MRLTDVQVHRDEAECHLDLLAQVGLLTADECAQVLLEKHLEDLHGARVPRDELNHGSSELRIADLPPSVVHNLEALDTANEGL